MEHLLTALLILQVPRSEGVREGLSSDNPWIVLLTCVGLLGFAVVAGAFRRWVLYGSSSKPADPMKRPVHLTVRWNPDHFFDNLTSEGYSLAHVAANERHDRRIAAYGQDLGDYLVTAYGNIHAAILSDLLPPIGSVDVVPDWNQSPPVKVGLDLAARQAFAQRAKSGHDPVHPDNLETLILAFLERYTPIEGHWEARAAGFWIDDEERYRQQWE